MLVTLAGRGWRGVASHTVSLCLKTSKTQWYKVGQLQLEGRSGCPWKDRLLAVSALLFSGFFS